MKEFLATLASKEPVPGGGGASALVGAVGCALASMVANLTDGKKKYADFQPRIEELLPWLENKREELVADIKKDAEAFYPLSQAYSLDKNAENRDEIMESALLVAAEAPLSIMEDIYELVPVLEELKINGSRLAISDVAVSAAACSMALKGAVMNIYINTKSMKNREKADELNLKATEILEDGVKRFDAVYAEISEQLKTKKAEFKELRGMPVVKKIVAEAADEIKELESKGIMPKLAVVRVGEREDDLSYERGLLKRFDAAGAEVEVKVLKEDVTQEELENCIKTLNADDKVHGILVFRPLPKHLNEEAIKNLVESRKDVDCMGDGNMAHVFMQDGRGHNPCTPQAVIEMLDFYEYNLTGKKAVVIGRSMVVGKPISMMLQKKNATVTMCHTRTKNLAEECRNADFIFAAAGVAKMIQKEYVKPGQVVIDVGINVLDGKLCGDVDYETVSGIVDAASPVPAGVGTVTTSILLKHVIASAKECL